MKINIDKIKHQVNDMINDINNNITNEEILTDKYHYLYNVSKSLFMFVMKNPNNVLKNLDKMLDYLLKIQSSEITEYDASVNVGKMLAKQYIPQYK